MFWVLRGVGVLGSGEEFSFLGKSLVFCLSFGISVYILVFDYVCLCFSLFICVISIFIF